MKNGDRHANATAAREAGLAARDRYAFIAVRSRLGLFDRERGRRLASRRMGGPSGGSVRAPAGPPPLELIAHLVLDEILAARAVAAAA